ncbi:hypothetical protein JTB14_001775 [Gonioctena quinquepunctata]|nr:hypothetical protein JTB14_001775 [Gonioctena quinquepunctata]
MDNDPEFVNVSIRIKPVNFKDDTSACLQIISKQPPVLFFIDRYQTFNFDKIFTEEDDQHTIYNETVKPLVDYVKQGYNCTVFAYGQTGTGKTYTIGTDSQVLKRRGFWTDSSNSESFFRVKGLKAQGFCQERVYNSYDARHFLNIGNKNRHTAGTKQNAQSSRSHAIFTIYCKVRHKDRETIAKLNLVDLAGCESVKKTGNEGSTFHEGVNINKGLLSIGQVMTALSVNSNFIPYRQSVITSILQDSLNKQNFISLIACVSPLAEDSTETSQTLEFAQRVKKMKNKPEVNEVVTQYKRDNPTLFVPPRTRTPLSKDPPNPIKPKAIKKQKPLPLNTINEPPDQSQSCSSINSISSVSNSVVSVLSNADLTQQTLSPVIKKYMTAMESSLMDKLQLVIQSTLKRPSRASLLAREKENSVNGTPSMNWNKIQTEVSKIVRTELAQLTTKSKRAASSPIEDHLENIKKVLNYGSPFDDTVKSNSNSASHTLEKSQFKVPELPVERKKRGNAQRTPSLSPIETIKTRRSVRLSLKRPNNNSQWYSICDENISMEGIKKLELSAKQS